MSRGIEPTREVLPDDTAGNSSRCSAVHPSRTRGAEEGWIAKEFAMDHTRTESRESSGLPLALGFMSYAALFAGSIGVLTICHAILY